MSEMQPLTKMTLICTCCWK